MLPVRIRRSARPLLVASALALVVTGCSVGSVGSSGGDASGSGEATTISVLYSTGTANEALMKALGDGFTAANPNVKLTFETQPGGTEGDNLNKTKLSTGEMSDVFYYNSGSLFQALNPDTNLAPLTDEAWVSQLSEQMKPVVSTPNGTYGAPLGTTFAGGVLYNKKVYEKLGLKVPTDVGRVHANNEEIKAAGSRPDHPDATGDTWTSQLFVLGDFDNVAAADPDWAAKYTANKAQVRRPAGRCRGSSTCRRPTTKGCFNKDFASATYDDGVEGLADR